MFIKLTVLPLYEAFSRSAVAVTLNIPAKQETI